MLRWTQIFPPKRLGPGCSTRSSSYVQEPSAPGPAQDRTIQKTHFDAANCVLMSGVQGNPGLEFGIHPGAAVDTLSKRGVAHRYTPSPVVHRLRCHSCPGQYHHKMLTDCCFSHNACPTKHYYTPSPVVHCLRCQSCPEQHHHQYSLAAALTMWHPKKIHTTPSPQVPELSCPGSTSKQCSPTSSLTTPCPTQYYITSSPVHRLKCQSCPGQYRQTLADCSSS